MNKRSLHTLALVLIFLSGLGLRIYFLFQPLTLDEAGTYVQFASHPLSLGLSYYPVPGNHLLNTFFIHFSTRLFGSAEWAIWLPALIFGMLILPLTYVVVRRLLGKYPALFAFAFVAFAPAMVNYSVEARGYSLLTVIFLLLVWLSVEMKEKGLNAGRSIAFSLLSVLGFYTLPTMLYFWVALVLWLLLSTIVGDVHGSKKRFVGMLLVNCAATGALTFLLYLPVIHRMGLRSLTANEWVATRQWSFFVSNLPNDLKGLWIFLTLGMPLALALAIALGFLLSVIFFRRLCPHKVNLPLVIIVCSAALVLIQRVNPFPRIWLPVMPLYFGFSFAGLFYGGKQAARLMKIKATHLGTMSSYLPEVVAIAIIVIFMFPVMLGPYPYLATQGENQAIPNMKTVVSTIKDHIGSSDLVCVDEWTAPLYQYYFERLGIPIRQFAPNQRIDAKTGSEIARPEQYVLLYYRKSPNLQVLAQKTAEARGFNINSETVGYLRIGDYDAFFLKNSVPGRLSDA